MGPFRHCSNMKSNLVSHPEVRRGGQALRLRYFAVIALKSAFTITAFMVVCNVVETIHKAGFSPAQLQAVLSAVWMAAVALAANIWR